MTDNTKRCSHVTNPSWKPSGRCVSPHAVARAGISSQTWLKREQHQHKQAPTHARCPHVFLEILATFQQEPSALGPLLLPSAHSSSPRWEDSEPVPIGTSSEAPAQDGTGTERSPRTPGSRSFYWKPFRGTSSPRRHSQTLTVPQHTQPLQKCPSQGEFFLMKEPFQLQKVQGSKHARGCKKIKPSHLSST